MITDSLVTDALMTDLPGAAAMLSRESLEEPGDGNPLRAHETAAAPLSESVISRSVISESVTSDPGSDLTVALWRLRAIEAFADLVRHGCEPRAAALQVGPSYSSFRRWLGRIEARKLDWANPAHRRQVLEVLKTRFANSGKNSPWEFLIKQPDVCKKLDTLYLATLGASSEYMTHGRRTGSLAMTLLRFSEEPECPAALAIEIRRGSQPAPLVRYLRRITPEIEARVRGPKHFALHGVVSRRDQTIRTEDGRRARNVAGFIVEFDDMSANQPFWVEGPDGPILSRQGLYSRDVASGRWLGCELIARPREAYRAEDILRFFRRLMTEYGKFDVLRLERGIWASRRIKGVRIMDTGVEVEETYERPEMAPEERTKLQDGLAAIGIEIDWAYTAHQKIIEGGFNHLQRIMATYTTDLVNVGRHAGEFEHAAKQVRRVRAGSHHPENLGFPSMDLLMERIERAFTFANRACGRSGVTTPDEIWFRDLAARQLPALTEIDLAAFLPEKRLRRIVGGRVMVIVDGQAHDFRADCLIELGHGYKVFVKLDPSEPMLGAAIYNRETSSANFKGYAIGDFICFAHWETPGPQCDLEHARGLATHDIQEIYGAGAQDDGYGRRKKQLEFVRTKFLALPRPGQPAVKTAEERDGRGNIARVESGRGAAAGEKVGEGERARGRKQEGMKTRGPAETETISAPRRAMEEETVEMVSMGRRLEPELETSIEYL